MNTEENSDEKICGNCQTRVKSDVKMCPKCTSPIRPAKSKWKGISFPAFFIGLVIFCAAMILVLPR